MAANDFIKANPFDAQQDVSDNIARITGKPIPGDLVIASFKNIEFTNDPIAASLAKNNKDAKAIQGLTAADSLKGIYESEVPQQGLDRCEGADRVHPAAVTASTDPKLAESSATPVVEDVPRPAVVLDHVSKVYGTEGDSLHALDDINLEVHQGEFVCLLGASGCGKSTLLNIVAGLDGPTTGTVDTGSNRTTLMFQESALFPWLTARGNVELPLKIRKVPRAERHRKADAVARDGEPRARSGASCRTSSPVACANGWRSARSLAQEADVLLMDEPFGALDAMTRDVLHDELERLWRETGLSVVFVTHNVREAVRLGDRVILLSSRPGRIVEEYPIDIERPRRLDSTEVAEQARIITDQLKDEVRRHGR